MLEITQMFKFHTIISVSFFFRNPNDEFFQFLFSNFHKFKPSPFTENRQKSPVHLFSIFSFLFFQIGIERKDPFFLQNFNFLLLSVFLPFLNCFCLLPPPLPLLFLQSQPLLWLLLLILPVVLLQLWLLLEPLTLPFLQP